MFETVDRRAKLQQREATWKSGILREDSHRFSSRFLLRGLIIDLSTVSDTQDEESGVNSFAVNSIVHAEAFSSMPPRNSDYQSG